jgi:hypothetical protein
MRASDLRTLIEVLDGVINRAMPVKSETELIDLRQRVAQLYAARGRERGDKIFEWRLPLFHERVLTRGKNKGKVRKQKMAPTMNELVAMNIWERSAVRERLDDVLKDVIEAWPEAGIQDSPRARAVRVTRFSHAQPDELGVDAIGGKVPIDRMVLAGILAGDTRKVLDREALWLYAPKNEGSLLIEVFELLEPT